MYKHISILVDMGYITSSGRDGKCELYYVTEKGINIVNKGD